MSENKLTLGLRVPIIRLLRKSSLCIRKHEFVIADDAMEILFKISAADASVQQEIEQITGIRTNANLIITYSLGYLDIPNFPSPNIGSFQDNYYFSFFRGQLTSHKNFANLLIGIVSKVV